MTQSVYVSVHVAGYGSVSLTQHRAHDHLFGADLGAAFAGATWLAVAQLASGLAALQWALVAALAAVTTG